jgi:hypothetical protein
MKFKILFLILFLFSTSSKADEAEDVFCNKSRSCKKVCKLKRKDEYSDLNEDHRQIMLKCMEDLDIIS